MICKSYCSSYSSFISSKNLDVIVTDNGTNFMKYPYNSTSKKTSANILIVDDSMDGRLLVEILLQDAGYQIQTADNGFSALAMVESSTPDLIILDLMMPEISGYDVIKSLRLNPKIPYIPILIMTACGYLEGLEDGHSEADGVIYKPIDLDKLLSQVRLLLEKVKKPRIPFNMLIS